MTHSSRALAVLSLLLSLGACADRSLSDTPDLAFKQCETLGGQCLPYGNCPADEAPIEGQFLSYCSDAINLSCCITRCPPSLLALRDKPCRLGSPICAYSQADSACGYAVCEPVAGGSVWITHIAACDSDMR